VFYAVRLEGTKEAVGLLFVERRKDLFDLVDELCDPYVCECKRIEGGIFWKTTDLKFGDTDYDAEDGEHDDEIDYDDEIEFVLDFSASTTSEGLLEAVSSDKGWSSIVRGPNDLPDFWCNLSEGELLND
tara:strand:+ start:191 stop:577 length:387 start_codon:yes stop_codon:yes gene_type:complete